MKTKGNFLSYIASEKKQRKEEVKPSAKTNSYSDYSGLKSKGSDVRMNYQSEVSSYQIS